MTPAQTVSVLIIRLFWVLFALALSFASYRTGRDAPALACTCGALSLISLGMAVML